MLYFLHGWYLAITGEPLVDDGFEKWQYGPVSRKIYDELKMYGSSPIGDYISEWDPVEGERTSYFVNTDVVQQFEPILERVWEKYSPMTAAQLSTLTHRPNTPWSRTEGKSKIDDDLIRQHFVELARLNRQESMGQ
jgi:uncharacterized phage-associated protein